LISYDVWMKETYSYTKPRSKELRFIDEALKVYKDGEPLRLTVLKTAFNEWKAKQGENWRSSVRNRTKICEKMDLLLNQPDAARPITAADLERFQLIETANKTNLVRMFRGQKLTVKPSVVLGTGRDVEQAVHKFKAATPPRPASAPAPSTGGGSDLTAKIHELLSSTFGGLPISEVQHAMGDFYHELFGAVIPFFGMFKSGGKAVVGWIQVARQSWAMYKADDARGSFAPGDPAAAFLAVLELMERQRNSTARDASIQTATFTAQALFTGLDAGLASGPMIGAASTLATVMHKLVLFARDYKETGKANKLLQAGKLDLSLFGVCPLLGAYIVACSDTSAVINMAVCDYGKPGWRFDVEGMKVKADPVITKAGSLIRASRYEIVSLRGNKGVVQPTIGLANKPFAVKAQVKKLVGA
jgi:hypothetical protein